MANLKRAAVETSDPAINVVSEEETVEASAEETNGSTPVAKDRMPWTAEKVRIVKAAVRESPGITFDALLTSLRAGELASHLEGAGGRQRLLNLLQNIRKTEAKAEERNAKLRAEGKEDEIVTFNPLPEVIMPVSMARPDLLAD